jgi:two-component system chemotaxis sensor kinase CheA
MANKDYDQFEEMKQLFGSEANEYLQLLNQSLVRLEKEPQNEDLLNDIFRVAHTLKSMAATMGFDKITEFSHEMESLLSKVRQGELIVTPEMIDILLKCSDTLQILKEEALDGTEEFDTKDIIFLLKKFAEADYTQEKQLEIQKVEDTPDAAPDKSSVIGKTTSVRINVKQLDVLMNLVGELVISKARLVDIGRKYQVPELKESLKQFDTIALNLQEQVLKTRLVPISYIFNSYPSMIRDLAKKREKELDFEIEGTDIEVDRMLLEEISPPLVHLLRNAVDHGIETSQERTKAQKNSTGEIRLTAKREKGYVKITVSDDGKGISVEKVKQAAIDKGFIEIEDAELMTRNEILMLICEPGFSTSTEITDTSGRGVGMDTVKALVEKFNGRFDINSEVGKGTAFVIQVPLSLAIMLALLVETKQETYAVPLRNVAEIVSLKEEEIKTIEQKEVFTLREEIVPLFRLEEFYGTDAMDKRSGGNAVIVEAGGKRLGIIVDKLIGQQEIVIKPLTGFIKKTRGFSGVTILGDGRVVLIMDVDELI